MSMITKTSIWIKKLMLAKKTKLNGLVRLIQKRTGTIKAEVDLSISLLKYSKIIYLTQKFLMQLVWNGMCLAVFSKESFLNTILNFPKYQTRLRMLFNTEMFGNTYFNLRFIQNF